MNLSDKVAQLGRSKSVRIAKWILLVLFIGLVLFDVFLVFADSWGYPTISRVVLNSTPKFMVTIWLMGIVTANIFFPRKDAPPGTSKLKRLLILMLIGLPILITGWQMDAQVAEKSCGELRSDGSFYWTFAEVHCINMKDTANFARIPCDCPVDDCCTKLNLKTPTKFGLLVFGLVCGFLFWPQVEGVREEESPG